LIPFRRVNGVLLLDKPEGISSNIALQRAKRLFQAAKAGHTGSLDPIATGLLPICFGEATKFTRFLLDSNKRYRVTAKLGIKTTTGDSEGVIISESAGIFPTKLIQEKLKQFRGSLQQIPPMYSALKSEGQPLYRLARQGISIERQARTIVIDEIHLLEHKIDTIVLDVRASKGTYMRVLVEDLGEALGSCAHLTALQRLGSGPYVSDDMQTLEDLEKKREEGGLEALDRMLLSVDSAAVGLRRLVLSENEALILKQGKTLKMAAETPLGWVRLSVLDQYFMGVGEVVAGGELVSRRLTQEMIPL